MALANLKSAYSFYTKIPPGFKPNASVNDTDFKFWLKVIMVIIMRMAFCAFTIEKLFKIMVLNLLKKKSLIVLG